MEETAYRLKYRIIETSSEDPEFPTFELMKGVDSNGWCSSRFCQYPQEILIRFLSPVHLKQINILSHEKKIPSLIEFYSFYPNSTNELFQNYKTLSFEKLGYIRMDSNTKTNYKAREYRKIYVNTYCMFIKLILNKNYVNKFNVFNQVSIISLEFIGNTIDIKKDERLLRESLKVVEVNEEEFDDLTKEKLRLLRNAQEEAIKVEDYDEAKRLKKNLDKIKFVGRKIYELDIQKKIFINNEDFDNAKILKYEIDRLKSNIKYIDKQVLSIQPVYGSNENEINKSMEIAEETKDPKDKEMKDENKDPQKSMIDQREISFSVNEINIERSLDKTNKSMERIIENDEFILHDDQIIPALKKKLNPNYSTIDQINESVIKGELEEIDPSIEKTYEILIKYTGEECFRKIFSKQVVYKDEGLEFFLTKMEDILKDPNELNIRINLIMKLVYSLLNERHPQICMRSIDIFKLLLAKISTMKEMNVDFTITDNILIKIKEKLGDVNLKLKKKAVLLYCYMLKLPFCDYNNLIYELVEEESKHVDLKRIAKSSKVILGKLDILTEVFKDFDFALKNKLTDKQNFPFNSVVNYVIENVAHSKSEVRKIARNTLIMTYKIFGFDRLSSFVKKIDEKELEKLVKDIPELKDIISSAIERKLNESRDYNNRNSSFSKNNKSPDHNKKSIERNRSQERNKTGEKNPKIPPNIKKEVPKPLVCQFCLKTDKKFLSEKDIVDHLNSACVFFMNCGSCKQNILVKEYNNHLLNSCLSKNEYKLCKRCKEPINLKLYDLHVKENKCVPAKNPNSANRCPLCHKDIPPLDKGWIQHLVKDICQKHQRRQKIISINGK